MIQITDDEAKMVAGLLSQFTVEELFRKPELLSLVNKMSTAFRPCSLFIYADTGKYVEMIKTVRILTGLGLKEAKDLSDRLNPNRQGGWFGPIMEIPTHEAKSFMLNWDRKIQSGDETFIRPGSYQLK